MSSASTDVRPAYRPYVLEVRAVDRVSPHFVRVTFTGDELEHFGTAGLDQRIKVLLPRTTGRYADFGQHEAAGDWYDRWRTLPHGERNALRTYTVRSVRPDARELDVDFVVHHDPGPAGAWALNAAVGEEIVIVGPDERSIHSRQGLDWHPGTATRLLLAGDETAAPAIAGILAALPAGCDVDVLLEVPLAADEPALPTAARARVRCVARDDAEHGARLLEALRAWTAESAELLSRAAAPRRQELEDVDVDTDLLWDSPEDAEGEFYAWIAGEAATVKTARRMLVSEFGVDRKRVAFMGYWRIGQSERQE